MNELNSLISAIIMQRSITYAKDIIQLSASCLTPLIAIIAAYIAYQQYNTNRQKLRLDLYDKRFQVFLGLQSLLIHILQTADVSDEALQHFQISTSESTFIFGKDISDYLQSIRKKALILRQQNLKLHHSNLPIGEERNKLAEAHSNLLFELTDQEFKISEQKFAKYLKIEI